MKSRVIMTCCLVAFSVGTAAAELRLGATGACAFPQGEMVLGGDKYYGEAGLSLGAGPGGGVRTWIKPWRFFEVEIGADYDKLPGVISPAEGTLIPIRGGVNLVADQGRYAISCGGGAGYYVFKATAYGTILYTISEEETEWISTWGKVSLSGFGLYYGFAASVKFGRWSLDFTPRWNQIFNQGPHDGEAIGEYAGHKLYFDLPYNCTYAEAMLGVSYRVFQAGALATLNVSHIASHAVGTFEVTVTVKESDGVTAVPDAVVCLYKEGDVHEAYVTDASGEVSFEVTADTAGEMTVTARKHAYVPYTGTITITE